MPISRPLTFTLLLSVLVHGFLLVWLSPTWFQWEHQPKQTDTVRFELTGNTKNAPTSSAELPVEQEEIQSTGDQNSKDSADDTLARQPTESEAITTPSELPPTNNPPEPSPVAPQLGQATRTETHPTENTTPPIPTQENSSSALKQNDQAPLPTGAAEKPEQTTEPTAKAGSVEETPLKQNSATLSEPTSNPSDSAVSVEATPQEQEPTIVEPLNAPRLEYPSLAKRRRQEGRVIIRGLLNRDGQLVQAEVVQSSGHASLDDSALEQVMNWQYRAPSRNAQEEWVRIPVEFRLR